MAEMMKNTGIEWIGRIPTEWTVNKVKYLAYMKGRIGWQGLKADEFIEEGPYLVTGTDFVNGKVNWETCYHISEQRYAEDPAIHVMLGDLLITKDGTVGKTAYIDVKPEKVSLNSHLLIIRPLKNEYDNRYLYWLINSPIFDVYTLYAQNGSIMASLSQEKIGAFCIPMPDLSEQKKIADFLDKQTSKIDAIIKTNEEQLEVLKKYKKSLITQTVTKGLNKNVKMKDSGIKDIGKIPEHWKALRLKYLCSITTGDEDTQNADADGQYPFYVRSPIVEHCNRYTFDGEGILVAGDGAGAGRIFHHVYGKYAVHQRVYRLYNFKCDSNYLHFYLSNFFPKEMDKGSAQSTVPSMRLPMLLNFKITIPTNEEQKRIADYLDEKCTKIDSLITQKQEAIETMQKYKKSLIYEYVTGKKRIK